MRVAVCISGQSRTWKVAYKSILSFFDMGANVDFFIHTWDTNSYRDIDIPRWECVDYKIEDNDEEYNIKKHGHLLCYNIYRYACFAFPHLI